MKLADALKIVQTPTSPGAEPFRVYLACGIFPLHLTTFLAAHLRERLPERAIEIETGLYGDLIGNLKRLQRSSAQAGAVVVEWPDLDPRLGLRRLGGWGPKVLPDIQATVKSNLKQIQKLLAEAAQSISVIVCLPTVPLPPISHQPVARWAPDILLLEKILAEFASASGSSGLKLLNRQRLDAVSPIAERLDVKSELSTGFPYRIAHASKVAEFLALLIHPISPKKGLITDLDDTLWRGLLGEEGVEGVSWELDRHSHIHALYQQLLSALSESGVLLGVASKNDPALVAKALARADLLLPEDRLFPVEAAWSPKSKSVGRILDAWNINADAVVFVDDSPLELGEVKSVYPEMECWRFPVDDEQSAYEFLETLRDVFGKPGIQEEDAIRAASVRSGTAFQRVAKGESDRSLKDFLGQLNAALTLEPVSVGESRAFELVNKTNQFNLNGRRLNDAQFRTALNRSGAVSLLVSYHDKYGPLGKIAVILGQLNSSILRIDTWVMSCRAFSRHIEHKCLEYLFESLNVSRIELDFQQTERNGPMRDFLHEFGDIEMSGPYKIPRATFINKKPILFHRINEANYA